MGFIERFNSLDLLWKVLGVIGSIICIGGFIIWFFRNYFKRGISFIWSGIRWLFKKIRIAFCIMGNWIRIIFTLNKLEKEIVDLRKQKNVIIRALATKYYETAIIRFRQGEAELYFMQLAEYLRLMYIGKINYNIEELSILDEILDMTSKYTADFIPPKWYLRNLMIYANHTGKIGKKEHNEKLIAILNKLYEIFGKDRILNIMAGNQE